MRPPWIFLGGLLLCAAISINFAPLRGKAVAYSLWFCFDLVAITFTAFLAFRPQSESHEKHIQHLGVWLRYMTAAVIVIAVIVHVDYFAHFYGYKSGLIGYNQGDNDWYVNSRPHAFSFEPSYLALFFAFCSFYLAFEAAVASRPLLPRWLAIFALVLSLNVLLFTFARSILITLVIMFLLLAFFLHRSGKLPRLRVTNMLGALVLAAALFLSVTPKTQLQAVYDRMIYRALKGTDLSVDSRLHGVTVAWQIARATNFRGVGIGSSYDYWYNNLDGKRWSLPLKEGEVGRQKIQNTWFEVLAELGVAGFALYLAFALSFSWAAYRAASRDWGSFAIVAFAGVATFFAFTAHWFPNICRTDVWVWYAIWGISIAAPTSPRPEA